MPHGISDAPIHLGWSYHLAAAVLNKAFEALDYVAPTKHIWRNYQCVEVPNPTVGAQALILAKHALGRTLDAAPILAISCPNGLTVSLALAGGVRTAVNASSGSKIDLASSVASLLAMASRMGVVATPAYESAPYCYNATHPIYNIRWTDSGTAYEDCIAIPTEPIVNCPGREIAVYGQAPGSLRSCESVAERCIPGVLFQSAPNSVTINGAYYTESRLCFTNPGGATEFTPLRLPGSPQYDIGPVNYNAPSQFVSDCLRVRNACQGYTPVPTTTQAISTTSTVQMRSSNSPIDTTSTPIRTSSLSPSLSPSASIATTQPSYISTTLTSIAPTSVYHATQAPLTSSSSSTALASPKTTVIRPSSTAGVTRNYPSSSIWEAARLSAPSVPTTSRSKAAIESTDLPSTPLTSATSAAPTPSNSPTESPEDSNDGRVMVIAGAVAGAGIATGVVIVTGAGIAQCIRYYRARQRRHVLLELAAMY